MKCAYDGPVPTRKYEQVLRAEGAEQNAGETSTPSPITSVRRRPSRSVWTRSPAGLGVSRSTIYSDFGSRAGLFDAFVVDLWERTGLPTLSEAVAAPDARQHLRDAIAAASRMKAQDLGIYRVLHAMDRSIRRRPPARATWSEPRGGVHHVAAGLEAEVCCGTSRWSGRPTCCGP